MIGMLKGIVEMDFPSHIFLNVQDVGYKVFVAPKLLANLKKGERATLYTHTHVKEESLELYGFLSLEDLSLFELLISVSGIGAKTALNVFSLGSGAKIKEEIEKGSVDFLTQVPRLGRKNAQKIILELRGKIDFTSGQRLSSEQRLSQEALLNFGYSRKEAEDAVKAVDASFQKAGEIVKEALKYLGKRK